MSKHISLTQGKVAIVDDDDYEWLSQWKWYAYKGALSWYAARNVQRERGTQRQIRITMHRQILGLKQDDGKETDHINNKGVDNRRANIRICTHQQNSSNKKKRSWHKGTLPTSQYKGVCWSKSNQKWHSQLVINGKHAHLGFYNDEIEAAKAYNDEAIRRFDNFAQINVI